MITGCSCDLLINILLTVYVLYPVKLLKWRSWCFYCSLGYIPGHIHAFWLIYRKMQAEERYGNGGFICEWNLWLGAVLKLSLLMAPYLCRRWQWSIWTTVQSTDARPGSILWSYWPIDWDVLSGFYGVHTGLGARMDCNVVFLRCANRTRSYQICFIIFYREPSVKQLNSGWTSSSSDNLYGHHDWTLLQFRVQR